MAVCVWPTYLMPEAALLFRIHRTVGSDCHHLWSICDDDANGSEVHQCLFFRKPLWICTTWNRYDDKNRDHRAVLQMVSHGLMTALFFAAIGMLYERTHTRAVKTWWIDEDDAIYQYCFFIAGLCSLGLPGFSGFVAEMTVFVGSLGTKRIVLSCSYNSCLYVHCSDCTVCIFSELPVNLSWVCEK